MLFISKCKCTVKRIGKFCTSLLVYINLFIWNTCRHNLGAEFLLQIVMCINYYITISF